MGRGRARRRVPRAPLRRMAPLRPCSPTTVLPPRFVCLGTPSPRAMRCPKGVFYSHRVLRRVACARGRGGARGARRHERAAPTRTRAARQAVYASPRRRRRAGARPATAPRLLPPVPADPGTPSPPCADRDRPGPGPPAEKSVIRSCGPDDCDSCRGELRESSLLLRIFLAIYFTDASEDDRAVHS